MTHHWTDEPEKTEPMPYIPINDRRVFYEWPDVLGCAAYLFIFLVFLWSILG